uniref:ARGOS-like protein n=1 Tax=Nelumbo nucifera TaxID=4432 RepID=A0A822Y1Y4_NELNU|nr:TPA_asm: hypothetical protein HUJ06_026539 [Nelumbo nucifera]
MSFETQEVDLRLPGGLISVQAHRTGVMDGRAKGSAALVDKSARHCHRSLSQGNRPANSRKSFPACYFSMESFLVLTCLTASLLILPLILPPLPPPPFMLLLLPIAILAVLMILALMPSDVRDIASSYIFGGLLVSAPTQDFEFKTGNTPEKPKLMIMMDINDSYKMISCSRLSGTVAPTPSDSQSKKETITHQ